MATIVDHTQAHYDVHETPYGKDYAWCPECVIVECGCGERLILKPSMTRCRCGEDHAAIVLEELSTRQQPLEEVLLHPWREKYDQRRRDRRSRSEYYDWLELRELE